MTYGVNLGLFAGRGPLAEVVRSNTPQSSARTYAAWRGLDRDRRLALVDAALAAANDDHEDGYPAAL